MSYVQLIREEQLIEAPEGTIYQEAV